jgi:O-methyltransferase
MLLADIIEAKGASDGSVQLHLFDTFEGMPRTDPGVDLHEQGDFADTNVDTVRALVGRERFVFLHRGFIPRTFAPLEDATIAFAHIDVDIYQSVWDCCTFIYPRVVSGGFIVFDDYGWPTCPGARRAVDDFFVGRREQPLVLPTGQAIVFVGGQSTS